jgi:hypothetical protein
MKKSFLFSLLLALTGATAMAQTTYTTYDQLRTDKMYTIRNAYGMVNNAAAYNWYMYATDGATTVAGVAPDALNLDDMGSYWVLEDASATTGKANSYYLKNFKTGTYVYFANTELNTPSQLLADQKTPLYMFEGAMATAETPTQGSTFISVNGVGTDTQDARGFHASGMKIWEWAGGGNQWLFQEYDLSKYYVKSADGHYMVEAADGSAIGTSTEQSDAAKWDMKVGDNDGSYTFKSNTGLLVSGTTNVSTGTSTQFDLIPSTTTTGAFNLAYTTADGAKAYLAAGATNVTSTSSLTEAGLSADWFISSSKSNENFVLPTTKDISGSYKTKMAMFTDQGTAVSDITTFTLDKANRKVTITGLCPDLASETVEGKYATHTGVLTIPGGTKSSGGKTIYGINSEEQQGDLVISMNSNATTFKTTSSISVDKDQYYGSAEWLIGDEYPITWSRQAPAGTYNFYCIGWESGKGGSGAAYDWTTKTVVAADGSVTITGLNMDLASTDVKGTFDVSDNSITIAKGTSTAAGLLTGFDYKANSYVDLKLYLSDDHTQMTCPMGIVLVSPTDNKTVTSWIDCTTTGAEYSSSATYPLIYSSTPLVTDLYVTMPFDVTATQGLPGTKTEAATQYQFKSPYYHLNSATNKLRFTVMGTNTGDNGDNGFYCFALSEFYMYDATGNAMTLTADMFNTNAQEPTEGPIANICDGVTTTDNYFHSRWSASVATEYHYVEITFQEPVKDFAFGFISRNLRTVPNKIVVSDGSYQSVGSAVIGDQVTNVADITTDQDYAFYGNLQRVSGEAPNGSGYYSGVKMVGATPNDGTPFRFVGDATNGYAIHFLAKNNYVKADTAWTACATVDTIGGAAKFTIAASTNLADAFNLSYISHWYDKDTKTAYEGCVYYLQDWGTNNMAVYPTGANGKVNDTDGESDWFIYKVNSYKGPDTTTGHGALSTGINTVTTSRTINNGLIYDLSGRLISHPTKGIYIRNGKKFIVK